MNSPEPNADRGTALNTALLVESPGSTLDMSDPGDDVQLRFRYQHSYAAIQCVRMLDSDAGPKAVFCENHEDVLLENQDGLFTGVQVKTRNVDRPPFKSTDEEFVKAIRRFARLVYRFRDWFTGFNFTTNHRFWNEKEKPENPEYLIRFLRDRGGAKRLRKDNPFRVFISDVCSGGQADEGSLIDALMRLRLAGYGSDLEHNYWNLVAVIGETRNLQSTCSLKTIYRIADNLIHLVYMASSKSIGDGVSELYRPEVDLEQLRETLSLSGKRLLPGEIDQLIERSMPENASNLLVTSGLVGAEVLPPGLDVMHQKLLVGEVEQERVGVIDDSVASMQKQYLEWAYKYETTEADKRVRHLKALVRDDCTEAAISAKDNSGSPYGSMMYTLLRSRLKSRTESSTEQLFGCGERHLLGLAGTMTEECTVWWSDTFTPKSTRS